MGGKGQEGRDRREGIGGKGWEGRDGREGERIYLLLQADHCILQTLELLRTSVRIGMHCDRRRGHGDRRRGHGQEGGTW